MYTLTMITRFMQSWLPPIVSMQVSHRQGQFLSCLKRIERVTDKSPKKAKKSSKPAGVNDMRSQVHRP